jgi:uncharacterized protein
MTTQFGSKLTLFCLLAVQIGCKQSGSRPQAQQQQQDAGQPSATGSAGSQVGAGGSSSSALDAGSPGSNLPTGGKAGSASQAGASAPVDAGTRSDAAVHVPVTLPAGAVSTPGKYSGLSDKIYKGYALTSQYVPVRDGTKLAVDLYRPKTMDGQVVTTPLPVLWMYTPYNRRYFSTGVQSGATGEVYPGAAARLIEYGYVVAVADFRGVYASYGKNAGYNRGEWVDSAKFDSYDLTEWFAAQPWSTGKVAMWGCSATGGSQMQALTTAPPHLKAVFPMSCEWDVYPFGVPGGMSASSGDTKAPPTASSSALRDSMAQPVDDDTSRTQLNAAIADHAGNIENPGYVPFRDSTATNIPVQWWIQSSPSTYIDQIKAGNIPAYVAANWDEAATKYGAFFTFNNLASPTKMIIGPMTHCAWPIVESQYKFDISVEEHRFFDYWLKAIENGVMDEPRVYYFTYNSPAGQEWRSATEWPLHDEKRTPYYLGAKTLDTAAPSDSSAHDEAKVDYSTTATSIASGLKYDSAPLSADIRVTGHPVADLWVASTANDGDFVATLQDVAPDGTATTYNIQGRLRASLRKETAPPYNNLGLPYHPMNQADAQPLTPGQPTELKFDVYPISIIFKAGHRIRLVLTFADSVTPKLTPVPTVSIYRDAMHPSSITLPIAAD